MLWEHSPSPGPTLQAFLLLSSSYRALSLCLSLPTSTPSLSLGEQPALGLLTCSGKGQVSQGPTIRAVLPAGFFPYTVGPTIFPFPRAALYLVDAPSVCQSIGSAIPCAEP